jgi:hypothetical protein
MTVEQAEDFAGLHERVLTFMGAFSSVQHHIDSLVGMYLRRNMPVLGEELDRQFLRRIRDDQRLPQEAHGQSFRGNGPLHRIWPTCS